MKAKSGNFNRHSFKTIFLKNLFFPAQIGAELNKMESTTFYNFVANIPRLNKTKAQNLRIIVALALCSVPHTILMDLMKVADSKTTDEFKLFAYSKIDHDDANTLKLQLNAIGADDISEIFNSMAIAVPVPLSDTAAAALRM